MRVLILGAGASKSAGYPLASELMRDIDAEMAQAGVMDRQAWTAWDQYRRSCSGHLRMILKCPNPEVTLSLLDLYEQAISAQDNDWMQTRIAKWRADGKVEEYDGYFESEERQQLRRGIEARDRLLECLHSYFSYRHWLDSRNRQRRDYLRQLLVSLEDGDIVVTFNWDTAVERTLAEEARWSPLSGYGFEKRLLLRSPIDEPAELPPEVPTQSRNVVLKLHGSFGWHCARDGSLYFDHRYYLQHLDFHWNQRPLPLIDPLAPRVGPPQDFALVYPTFLKQLRGTVMQEIWYKAANALSRASAVEVWGYSLPESDLGVRVLLNSLRVRLSTGCVQVRVHVGDDSEAQQRWHDFLGEGAIIDGARLG